MISLILRIVAFGLFVIAGINQTLFNQPPFDLVAFGLGAWVLATLFSSVNLPNFNKSD